MLQFAVGFIAMMAVYSVFFLAQWLYEKYADETVFVCVMAIIVYILIGCYHMICLIGECILKLVT